MIDPADLRAAADLLDRYPSEVYMLNKHCREAADEIDRLRAENGRFRSALETIAESSTDRLKALQAKAALTNIGAEL